MIPAIRTPTRVTGALLGAVLAALPFASPVAAQGPPPAKVTVDTARMETVREGVTLIGTVEAFQTSTVASLAAGRVLQLAVRTGDRVKLGDALAVLDTTEYGISLTQFKAQADATRVRLAQAQADLELARKLLPEQAISTDEVATRERTVLQTRNQLAQAEAEVARLAYIIDQATIRAPFAGAVAAELAQAGEWVAEGGGVARLVDLSTARVKVWVPENIVGGITVGDTAEVDTAAGPARGRVHAVIPEGDPKSRTFPVEVRVPNPDERLPAGMLARVTFGVGKAAKALTVPADAVVTRGSEAFLWKVADGAALRVPVTTGRRAGDRVEVRPQGAELNPGDQVVTRGNERVRDGQALAVGP